MIAIKDFDMPIECDSCPFYMYHNDAEDTCKITGEGLYHVKFGERHEKCPLVNIPIDARYLPEDVGDFQKGYNLALDEIKEQLV